MLTLTNEQEVTLAVTPKTAAGAVGKIDGAPEWTLSDPTKAQLLTTDTAGNPLPPGQVVVWPLDGAVGSFQVIATCDADLGSGVKAIAGTFELEVLAPEATVAEVSAIGEVAPKRPATS